VSYGASLEASWTYDNEGKMVSVTYPNGGKTHTYTFDSMGRPQKETDNSGTPVDWAKGAQYGPAGELTLLQYTSDGTNNNYYTENRQYNSRLQLHEMWVTGVVNLTYNYAAGQNNGRIVKLNDWISGEETNYSYDSLNRLATAYTTGPLARASSGQWGQLSDVSSSNAAKLSSSPSMPVSTS